MATDKNSGGKLNELVEMFRDPYERKARAFPGLLMVLPILVAVASTWGTKHPIITGVVAVLVSCGTIFALGNLARDLGKEKQEKLVKDWGGMPTTWMLRHRDRTLEGGIKTVYHQLITQKLGLKMPTAQEELADPQAADDEYGTAARMLRDLTRGKEYSLLLKENISYGFRRNMYGARKLGWAISFVGILIGTVLSGAITTRPWDFDATKFLDLPVSSALTLGVSFAMFMAWFYFGPAAVRRMGIAYSERLLEALRTIPGPPAARKKAAPKKDPQPS
ncbi:hypothetical protein C8244_19225 [Paracidovorax avenae]|uniref:hypothetical protein n=1 Tax=Paracidovorax avenae TaxID=80867 RepID=UPI000D17D1AD|nr:hypothetical protein [Paracidovorax avenae]AVT18095.1 hypothetical protein C8244_19225 [Paracidovorax avenae]